MNILMLTSSYPKYPGETTAPFIEEIAAGLVQRGHTVHVVAPFHRDVRRAPVERGVHLHFFHYSPLPSLNIWGYAESLKADIGLHGRALLAAPLALGASTLALLRLSGEQRFDIVHAHWLLPNGVPAAVAARLRGLPLVLSLHGSDVFLAERTPPLSLTGSATLRAAAQITACSQDLRDRALRLGADTRRVSVVPYGVDIQSFQPNQQAALAVRAELALPIGAPLIVSISRLVYKKGLSYLLDAFPAVLKQHPTATLVLAGYGDLRDELERHAHELGISARVVFPGKLEREQAARYMSAADLYVVPSIRDQSGNVDGLPNVLLEAMGAARPIVATRLAGIPEVIDDGVHGLLVPERDAAALSAAINSLLANPDLAQRLGANARERIVRELTWDAVAARFEHVYECAESGVRS